MASVPKAPDPVKTANAQAGMNRDTALTEQMINMVSQNNPWGSIQYTQNGNNSFVGADGKTVTVPSYMQTTTYTPEQQAIFDKTQQTQTNLADLGVEQSAKMQQYLKDPFQFSNQDAADWAYDLGSSRILPQQEQQRKALEAQLINSGIQRGTQAWDAEMSRMTNANTDQMNQLMLQGRGQAFNENLTTRNQPINEITALLSGTQLQNPGAMSPGTGNVGVGGVDYTGLVNQQYQAKAANSGALMGGLFGLAGTGLRMGFGG